MLDLRFVADNIDLVKAKLAQRNSSLDLEEIASLAADRKRTIQQAEALKADKNQVSSQIAALKRNKENADTLIAEMRGQGEKIKELDALLSDIEESWRRICIPFPICLTIACLTARMATTMSK